MYAVEMRKITKRFGSFTANDQIDFLVKKVKYTACQEKTEQEKQH